MDGNIPDGDFKLVEVEKCVNHGYPNYIRNEKK